MYNFQDGEFYYLDTGKSVAKLVNGKIEFFPGMQMQHKDKLIKWVIKNKLCFNHENAAEDELSNKSADQEPEQTKIDINAIPFEYLPRFDPFVGIDSNIKAFIKKNKLNSQDIECLIKRLEKGK